MTSWNRDPRVTCQPGMLMSDKCLLASQPWPAESQPMGPLSSSIHPSTTACLVMEVTCRLPLTPGLPDPFWDGTRGPGLCEALSGLLTSLGCPGGSERGSQLRRLPRVIQARPVCWNRVCVGGERAGGTVPISWTGPLTLCTSASSSASGDSDS